MSLEGVVLGRTVGKAGVQGAPVDGCNDLITKRNREYLPLEAESR